MSEPSADERPLLRIVSGNPTPEEIAVLTVVLTAISHSASGESEPVTRSGGWADPSLRMRPMIQPAPGAWRAAVWH